jgi:probable HAF family extracellular repeat protein
MKGLGTVGDPNYSIVWCDLPFDASGINDSNQVVGFLAGSYNETQWGFVWTKAQGMKLLGGSWVPTFSQAVNNSGAIVGQNSVDDSTGITIFIGHATLWTSSDVATDLGSLGGGPEVSDFASTANGVNDRGQMVGWSTTTPVSFAGSHVHAVIWNASTGITDLGTLPGDTSSAALKINVSGQVIGSSGTSVYVFPFEQSLPFEVTGRPFIWSATAGMRDLNKLIPANSGWVLNSVSDINIWGQIVGSGTHKGKPHGFLLTPKVLW